MSTSEGGLISYVISCLFDSPLNTGLTIACAYLLFRVLRGDPKRGKDDSDSFVVPPPLEKHNMTHEELRKYDGKGPDGRICVAVCGKVFDVSKGRRFYGPDGPYSTFGGKDATRALGTFDVNAVRDDYDDLSGLTPSQLASSEEWFMQFTERYDVVGDLVRPDKAAETETESRSNNGQSGDENTSK